MPDLNFISIGITVMMGVDGRIAERKNYVGKYEILIKQPNGRLQNN